MLAAHRHVCLRHAELCSELLALGQCAALGLGRRLRARSTGERVARSEGSVAVRRAVRRGGVATLRIDRCCTGAYGRHAGARAAGAAGEDGQLVALERLQRASKCGELAWVGAEAVDVELCIGGASVATVERL